MEKMPPPRKPGLVIAVGIGKKGGDPGRSKPRPSADDSERMPPPGIDHPEAHDQDQESGGKATPEKALRVPEDHHCKDCVNWMPDTGECQKVEGVWVPEDACLRYFRHADESDEEPDEDESGGPSDQDADDMPGPAGPPGT